MTDRLFIRECCDEAEHLSFYAALLSDLYAAYPPVIQARIREAERNFGKANPFFSFGRSVSFLLTDGGKPAGHISAFLDDRLPKAVGLIGYFECSDDSGAAALLFDRACAHLSESGIRNVRGPVNFTTWQTFRVSFPENAPPFFTEPFTRGYYRNLFRQNGFTVSQSNISAAFPIDGTEFSRHEQHLLRLQQEGMMFETMSRSGPDMLQDIYRLTGTIFADTWSFVPVTLHEFIYFSEGIVPLLDGDFIFLVRGRDRTPAAFCFCAPDRYATGQQRLVIKTLGVAAGYRGRGIAKALLFLVHRTAQKRGFTEMIASTMRVGNDPIRGIIPCDRIYREYEVFEKNIP